MPDISNFFFPNDVSQSHVIYHFDKYATISWDCDTSFENQLLKKKLGCLAFLLISSFLWEREKLKLVHFVLYKNP
jgi:hypothetical protein